MTTERFTAEKLATQHAPTETTETHPRPTPEQHRERSAMRHAADDRTQGKVWLAFYVGLGLLVFIGLAAGLGQRADHGEALPSAPPAAH